VVSLCSKLCSYVADITLRESVWNDELSELCIYTTVCELVSNTYIWTHKLSFVLTRHKPDLMLSNPTTQSEVFTLQKILDLAEV